MTMRITPEQKPLRFAKMSAALKSKPPLSFEKQDAGGVLKSPFFKDTAVSEEVSPCPFLLFITRIFLIS